MDPIVRVKRKGQITLPVLVRAQLALREGDLLRVSVHGRQVVLEPAVHVRPIAVQVDVRRLDALVGSADLGGDAVSDAERYDE